ncbi:hypothetical protein GCM10018780_75720 [Streptomyces lanatus]|nr:hypothetical protein GCM10018780_75720 [Streptomyces lanatus]
MTGPGGAVCPLPLDRALGTVIGSAVGDALGAPFEFGPAGAFSARFPEPGQGGEMCGGGGWEPGEATDDTQMAVLVGESLLECGGLELPDVFRRFRRWAAADPKDIGLQTEAVLSSGDPWDLAAALHFQVSQRAAGNGALMRAATSAVRFARQGREATMDAARRLAALTHGDRAAWEGTAVFHELVRVSLTGEDPLAALPDTLDAVHPTIGSGTPPSSPPTGIPAWPLSSTAPSGPASAPPSGPCAAPPPTRTPYAPRSTSAATPTRSRP